MKAVIFGLMAGITIAAIMLILFVVGAINQDALTSNLARVGAVIAILVFTFIAIMALAGINKED